MFKKRTLERVFFRERILSGLGVPVLIPLRLLRESRVLHSSEDESPQPKRGHTRPLTPKEI